MSEETATEMRCTATIGNALGESYRCIFSPGHDRAVDVSGNLHDHTSIEPNLPQAHNAVYWDDSDPGATAPDVTPLPQHEPGAAMRCESRPGIFSGADNKPRCTLAAGHEGYHRGEEGVSWGVGAPPAASPVDDASSWIGKVFGGLGGPALKLTALNPQPVRVRFVDLPHRDVPREVDGVPLRTIEPGGFALVVDRFGTAQRCADERGRWDAFGLAVGAATVLCYPGELDIVGWLDGS